MRTGAVFELDVYLTGLATIAIAVLAVWAVSLFKRDVSIVDSLWGLLFVIAAASYGYAADESGPRAVLVYMLVGLWAVRLSGYITWRNWGEPEDHRYRQIRANNEPHFALKSLYIVFGLQGLLAWIISLPLLAAILGRTGIGWLDYTGILLWVAGFSFETIADYQLARFKADRANAGKVMDRGLWAYSRHPNYFGEFCIWWGFYLIAVGAGGWWTIVSPLLMSFLLLKVSGVSLLEKDIADRRPAYAAYAERTSAFFPRPPQT